MLWTPPSTRKRWGGQIATSLPPHRAPVVVGRAGRGMNHQKVEKFASWYFQVTALWLCVVEVCLRVVCVVVGECVWGAGGVREIVTQGPRVPDHQLVHIGYPASLPVVLLAQVCVCVRDAAWGAGGGGGCELPEKLSWPLLGGLLDVALGRPSVKTEGG